MQGKLNEQILCGEIGTHVCGTGGGCGSDYGALDWRIGKISPPPPKKNKNTSKKFSDWEMELKVCSLVENIKVLFDSRILKYLITL